MKEVKLTNNMIYLVASFAFIIYQLTVNGV